MERSWMIDRIRRFRKNHRAEYMNSVNVSLQLMMAGRPYKIKKPPDLKTWVQSMPGSVEILSNFSELSLPIEATEDINSELQDLHTFNDGSSQLFRTTAKDLRYFDFFGPPTTEARATTTYIHPMLASKRHIS
ncbi:hypothetical protein AVEN_128557-1 [Araneus ventricosus]|uniref:Uncharacterized protein n=1 Tax=Araneus ventricosus TaxID=182803 RepID=A0A4Y2L4S2_ARAVE|nr:hypothetical protein AVEN_128557-1 [Araneus ventricosus]